MGFWGFGVLVENETDKNDCVLCKYCDSDIVGVCKFCHDNSYFLSDLEAAKLESELTPETFTINDMYVESKLLFNCQDQLEDLQIENKQLKKRVKELEQTIENNVTEVSEFFNDGVGIFECNSCGMLMEENEPYNNFCTNCWRKIIR